jgi:hypothetical protein
MKYESIQALKIQNLSGFIKDIDNYNTLKKELKKFLLLHTFYSVEEFVSC